MRVNKRPLTYQEKLEKWDEATKECNFKIGSIAGGRCVSWLEFYNGVINYYHKLPTIIQKKALLETLKYSDIVLCDADDPMCDAPVKDLPFGKTWIIYVLRVPNPEDLKYNEAKKNKVSAKMVDLYFSRITSTEESEYEYRCETGHLYVKYKDLISNYVEKIFDTYIKGKYESTKDEELDMSSLKIWLIKDGEIGFTVSSNLREYRGYYLNIPGGELSISSQSNEVFETIYGPEVLTTFNS